MTTCVDLRQRFGKQFRVKLDKATYMAEPEAYRGIEKPWHYRLLCTSGHIYPHGGELLGVATDKRGAVATRLAELDCVTITQDGADGVNGTCHVDDFPKVAANVKPRRQRIPTPTQRTANIERLRAYKFDAR